MLLDNFDIFKSAISLEQWGRSQCDFLHEKRLKEDESWFESF